MSTQHLVRAAEEGCYEAPRAAALSGVPLSTVYQWARAGVVVPSVSPTREKLWSYADLMTLRLVAWLRHPKQVLDDERPVRASPLTRVKEALRVMGDRGVVDPWSTLAFAEDSLDLLRPFALASQPGGPDLVRPRPTLRIVPTKVAGELHVEDTRITSRTISALVRRGLAVSTVSRWYDVPERAVTEAANLEDQLASAPAAA